MSRRSPSSEIVSNNYFTNVSGVVTLLAGDSGCAYELRQADIAAVGVAGSGTFSSNGVALATINGSASYQFPQTTELPVGSGLVFDSSTPVNISIWYVCWPESAGITKSAARNATYVASLASPKAIRAPNVFGGQVEG